MGRIDKVDAVLVNYLVKRIYEAGIARERYAFDVILEKECVRRVHSGIFKLADRDRYIAVADRWMPDALMTAGEVDVISRAIAARSDKSIRVTAREKLQMARRMTMQVDTSIADYVWLPIRFDGETPRIEWRERWTPDEL